MQAQSYMALLHARLLARCLVDDRSMAFMKYVIFTIDQAECLQMARETMYSSLQPILGGNCLRTKCLKPAFKGDHTHTFVTWLHHLPP